MVVLGVEVSEVKKNKSFALSYFARDITKHLFQPFVSVESTSMVELESELWIYRVIVGALFGLLIVITNIHIPLVPVLICAGIYVALYTALRLSKLRCPKFCFLLFALDVTFITTVVYLANGQDNLFWSLYLFPVAVMAVSRGTGPALILGTLVLGIWTIIAFDKDSTGHLLFLAILIYGIAPVVGSAHRSVTRHKEELTAGMLRLQEGLLHLSTDKSTSDLLQQAIDLGVHLTGASYGALSIWDVEGVGRYFKTSGIAADHPKIKGEPPSLTGLLQDVVRSKTSIRLQNAKPYLSGLPLPKGHPDIGSFLGVPINETPGYAGAFYLINKKSNKSFSQADERLCKIMASHVASTMVMRLLSENQKEVYDSFLKILVQINDVREYASIGHSERVSSLARQLAIAAGVGDEEVELISTAGLLHDIGKIGVPENMLSKPSSLTNEERTLMMSHSNIGYDIASQAGPLAGAARYILYHHEWWNGKGYPDGLKGNEIPIGAQIVSICDAFDSMTDDRPYRSHKTTQEALAEIKTSAGTQFNPNLANLFVKIQRNTVKDAPALDPQLGGNRRIATLAEQSGAARNAGWRLFIRLSKELETLLDIKRTSERIIKLLCEDLDLSSAAIGVLDKNDVLKIIAWEGSPVLVDTGTILEKDKSLSWTAIMERRTLVVPDVVAHPKFIGRPDVGTANGVFLPLVANGKTAGVLMLFRRPPQSFGEYDIAYLEAAATPVAELLLIAQLHERVEEAAIIDPLTEIYNRRYGIEQLNNYCAEYVRSKEPFSVIVLDLNRFKQVNDVYGHQAGDAVLKETVARLKRTLRESEMLCRFGGDEFVIIAKHAGSVEAQVLAERIVTANAFDDQMLFEDITLPIPRWCIGIASCPTDGVTPADLLRAADQRLYEAKKLVHLQSN